MNTLVNDIVIVGGGSSGWLAAASISNRIPGVNVTLVDKEEPEIVGVGEATLLGFAGFMNDCGFDHREWMNATDAVIKVGILFPDWGEDGTNIWHPFFFFGGEEPMVDVWSNHQDIPFHRTLPVYESVARNRINIHKMDSYALHIDCGKLVQYISNKIKDRVTVINSTVESFKDNTLRLRNGNDVKADLFIDCTGFKRLLKDTDKLDLTDRLYVDTAVAGHIPYTNKDEQLHPYTACTNVDHGWIWDTPLRTRIGSGLVFNRSVTDINEAKESLCKFWNGVVSPDDLKVIDWTPFYDKKPWDNKVVSVGLSAGFIEPLESTGISLIIEGANQLASYVRGRYFNQFDINSFNTYMINMFETCTDFVSMHYDLSTIQSPFWEYVRGTYQRSEQHNVYIDNMKSNIPSIINGKPAMFGGSNWIYWMMQMGYELSPKMTPDPLFARRSLEQYNEFKSQTPLNIVKLKDMNMNDLIVKPIPIF